jgi:ribonuclease G
MAKEICISSTPHETRLAILEDDQLTEIYYERENEYTLAGSIYKGRVTRVLPGMQSAFVDLGLERDAFLYVTDFMEEQEESADFEKVPNSNGGRSREGQAPREPQVAREPQAVREPREARSPRGGIAIEGEPRPAPVVEGRGSVPGAAGDAAGGEDDQQGTRRWRGRRGRRRGGRPQGAREAGPAPVQSREEVDPAAGFEIQVETGPTIYEETVAYGGGQAGFSEVERESAPVREEIPAPRLSAAAAPVIVLPGESLSRYGGKPAESAARPEVRPSASSAPAVSTYKPSTLVEVVPGWDGGAELPGETLSRYRNKPVQAAVVAPVDPLPEVSEIVSQAWEGATAAEPLTNEEIRSDVSAEASVTIEAPVDLAHEAVAEHAPEAVVEHAEVPLAEHHEPVEAPVEASTAVHEEEQHFEPESASASYRIDPTAPSEYRVSSVLQPETTVESEIKEPAAAYVHEAEAVEEHAAIEEPAAFAEQVAAEPEIVPEAVLAEPHVEQITPPEELSAAVYEDAVLPAPVDSSSQAVDPLLERSEALPATEELPHTAEVEFFDDGEEDDQAGSPQSFAPGAGTIEEEVIDEEEYDFEPIHAHGDEHDLDDLEEETLDSLAGAEISELVRDAHLNQRIGVSPDGVVEDEDHEAEYGEVESDVDDEEEEAGEEQAAASTPAPARREGRTDDGRRGGGRGPRRRSGRPNGGGGGGGSRRANSQLSDLPIISELLKQGQEILVQIAKEPIAKKGARITSHIALPGRFLVFMPTVNHVGVSRKISSDEERQRLKRILTSEKGTASGGFIVRTAADGASEDDLRADIRFLISLWNDIKQRADDGKAPALIYHDLNLIERVLRDQVSANFSTIWVDNEAEYERIVRFLQRFEPSLVRRVKLYTKETPLFEQFGIQDEIGKALKSKVWLKSGGSIVINQTEALVAIDINTGKYVGKTARLEDTIVKTNLDAIPEIVRQIRLRDLGGIIIIDFIDMDDRRNRHKVMAALEEELKNDRAPSKVLQFNDFGLVAITRKRVKQSLERTLSVQCEICAGTGMVKSPTTVCNEIYTELRKMQKHLERGDVLLRVNPEVVKTLKANNAKWLNELEEMTGKTIIVKSDPALHPEQFDIQ